MANIISQTIDHQLSSVRKMASEDAGLLSIMKNTENELSDESSVSEEENEEQEKNKNSDTESIPTTENPQTPPLMIFSTTTGETWLEKNAIYPQYIEMIGSIHDDPNDHDHTQSQTVYKFENNWIAVDAWGGDALFDTVDEIIAFLKDFFYEIYSVTIKDNEKNRQQKREEAEVIIQNFLHDINKYGLENVTVKCETCGEIASIKPPHEGSGSIECCSLSCQRVRRRQKKNLKTLKIKQ